MRNRRYFLQASLACGVFYAGKIWSQPKIRRVGILSVADIQPWYQPFYEVLTKEGWIEGQNLTYEFRHANGDPTRFAEPLAELVRTKPDVIFAVGPPAVRAAFASVKDIPIVAHDLESDPVVSGYAKSYARPGGNLTGIFLDSPDLAGKWVEILKSIVPRLSRDSEEASASRCFHVPALRREWRIVGLRTTDAGYRQSLRCVGIENSQG